SPRKQQECHFSDDQHACPYVASEPQRCCCCHTDQHRHNHHGDGFIQHPMPEKCCLRGRQNQAKQTKRSGQSARNESTSTKGLRELRLSFGSSFYRQVDGRDGHTQRERHGSDRERKRREPIRSSIGNNLTFVLNHDHATGN